MIQSQFCVRAFDLPLEAIIDFVPELFHPCRPAVGARDVVQCQELVGVFAVDFEVSFYARIVVVGVDEHQVDGAE